MGIPHFMIELIPEVQTADYPDLILHRVQRPKIEKHVTTENS